MAYNIIITIIIARFCRLRRMRAKKFYSAYILVDLRYSAI